MNQNYYEHTNQTQFSRSMSKTYAWMFLGLLVTTLTAALTISSVARGNYFLITGFVPFVFLIGEFILVIFLSSRIMKMSHSTATLCFLLYATLNGITLSSIFFVYSPLAVIYAFGFTAFAFGAMSIYGFVTKNDLTRTRSLMLFGLFGIIIASVLNLFIQSAPLYRMISYLGVIIFLGLTAYDTQKIKYLSSSLSNTGRQDNIPILCALTLYLDFINLFLFILRIFGRRR